MKPKSDAKSAKRRAGRDATADEVDHAAADAVGSENPRVQDAPPRPGQTRVQREGRRLPRLPHERDTSTDSQRQLADSPDKSMQQASIDLARGLQDTDRGPVVERIAREHFDPPRKVPRRSPRKSKRGPA